MPDTTTDDLAGYVGARICHDVINPLGAIGNGLELLMLTFGTQSPELELLEASVKNAQARVKFLRIAFGAAVDPAPVGAAESRAVLAAYCDGMRHKVAWQIDEDLPRSEQRRAFLMLLCVFSALPLGGEILIDSDGTALTVSAKAPRISASAEAWGPLLQGQSPPETSAATVHFALLALEIGRENATGRRAHLDTTASSLRFTF